jgi:hypothetical protein
MPPQLLVDMVELVLLPQFLAHKFNMLEAVAVRVMILNKDLALVVAVMLEDYPELPQAGLLEQAVVVVAYIQPQLQMLVLAALAS